MKVRSQVEIQTLDDELNLFEESEWDFMSIVDTRGSNYEYFNDIRDTDFDLKKGRSNEVVAYAALFISVLAIMVLVALKVTNFFDDSEWRELNNLQSVQGGLGVTSVVDGGVEATPEELVGVSNTLNNYVTCLKAKGDYNALDDLCMSKSQFAKKYYESVNSVITIYDVNDCYARGLREFASYYSVQRFNRVVKKDDIYYCYVSVEYPTIYDVSEFINMNNQTFVKKFQGWYEVTDAEVAKFLLEVIAENNVPMSSSDVCIQMKEQDGKFVISDDSFMLTMASDDYSIAMNQLLKSMEGLLTN